MDAATARLSPSARCPYTSLSDRDAGVTQDLQHDMQRFPWASISEPPSAATRAGASGKPALLASLEKVREKFSGSIGVPISLAKINP
jgi:hypothetical protein